MPTVSLLGKCQFKLPDLHRVTINWGFKNHVKNSSEMVLGVHYPSFPSQQHWSLFLFDCNLCFGGGNFYYSQLSSDSFFLFKRVPSWPNFKWSFQSTPSHQWVCAHRFDKLHRRPRCGAIHSTHYLQAGSYSQKRPSLCIKFNSERTILVWKPENLTSSII